jgi:hypothetical protein
MDQVLLHSFLSVELERERHRHPQRLTRYGRKVYSQNDEDGIIAEIFTRIGVEHRSFIEFGTETGIECNTTWLLMQGWQGLWIESDADACKSIVATHGDFLARGDLTVLNERVTAENINSCIVEAFRRDECDLLSIDVDYNDYWIWQAIDRIEPRVVLIEYNASWPPPSCVTVPYDPAGAWRGDNLFGASLAALAKLGDRKGYHLVGCSLSGVNAFFVRKDLCGEYFLAPGSATEHYEPARYFLSGLQSGHRPAIGSLVEV